MQTIKERIAALRESMARYRLAAYIVPGSDPHLGEYVPARWRCREWISGFTGSAGTVVVTASKAGLWTDSRYFLQAGEQLQGTGVDLYKLMIPGTPSIADFLLAELPEGAVVGLDGQTFSAAEARRLRAALERKRLALDTSRDLIGEVWEGRPPMPEDPVFEMPVEVAGRSVSDKLAEINNRLHREGADGLILTALDEVAWTFNIRGTDVAYSPVALAYAFISEKESVLFIHPGKMPAEIGARLKKEGVILADYGKIREYLSKLPASYTVHLDPAQTNTALFEALPASCKIIEGITPANHLKSIKNPTEIQGFRCALLKDGLALTKFYFWLEKQLEAGRTVTELDASAKLSALRAEQPGCLMDSFECISAYGAHGAIVHYAPTKETDVPLRPGNLFLMDSGAQFTDGTTDITRTIALGEPSEAMKKDFTRALKGTIDLAKCKFPAGLRGCLIDAFARKPLWDAGIQYLHGTSHGIGHCLNVHEGPQSIRMEENPVALRPGMIMSDEPGIYRTGQYGIRIENMLLVVEDSETEFGKFLSFETLTLCYIDTRLVVPSMLSVRERAWLNKYQQNVYEKLSPLLGKEEADWLRNKTREI
ncbi:MAG: aminopeptidase P family protein [Tannerella sp.]|jgi:Xaa-Pro aminopeptidase|nr:aminopeptidase P family protein [Tannerella sp.]